MVVGREGASVKRAYRARQQRAPTRARWALANASFLSSSFTHMASVSRLRAILQSAFSPRGLPNGEQEFFEELMAHRPQLVDLYDVGPRNPQEQRELESGQFGLATRPAHT